MISSPLALAGVVTIVAALAFWLDRRVKPLSRVGASLLAIIIGAILSNLGLVPASSPIYDAVGGPVTSLAIAWLLLSVNVSDLKDAGGPMIAAFGVAVVGWSLGAATFPERGFEGVGYAVHLLVAGDARSGGVAANNGAMLRPPVALPLLEA